MIAARFNPLDYRFPDKGASEQANRDAVFHPQTGDDTLPCVGCSCATSTTAKTTAPAYAAAGQAATTATNCCHCASRAPGGDHPGDCRGDPGLRLSCPATSPPTPAASPKWSWSTARLRRCRHPPQVLGKLNGPTVALSRAIPRGVREGWWPEGTTAPITVVYDPENPSWQKAKGYEMTGENVPVFRAAIARMAIAKGAAESLGLTPGGTGKTSESFPPDRSTLGGYTPVDLDGGSLPADDQDEDDGVMQCHVFLQPDEQGNASHLDTARDTDHIPRS